MSGCDCGVPKGTWRENFHDNAYDRQAREIIAPPAPREEGLRPAKPDRNKQVVDFNPQTSAPAVPGVPSVFTIANPLSVLAIGGYVPFNARCFFAPAGALANLSTQRLRELASALQYYALSGFQAPALVALDQYWIMSPGEILDLGVRLGDGVDGFFFAPWSGLVPDLYNVAINLLNSFRLTNMQAGQNGLAAAQGVVDGFATGQNNTIQNGQYLTGQTFDPISPMLGPIFAPVVRASLGRSHMIAQPVVFTPWVVPGVIMGLNGDMSNVVCIPPGARYVTVSWSAPGNVGYQNGLAISNGGRLNLNGNYTPMDGYVEWLGYDCNRHRHPADQLTAAARGQIMYGHDIETYEVPRLAAGMVIGCSAGSGPVPQLCYTFSADTWGR